MGIFGWLNRWGERSFEKRLIKAAQRKSPVTVEVSTQARNRFAVLVNGDNLWVEIKQFIALTKAREIVKRLEAQGFEVISAFGSPRRGKR